MKLKELVSFLDTAIPVSFQESYDNSGLQLGDPETDISRALLTLEINARVMDDAIRENCDVIISHHPLIFDGLKKITGRTTTEKLVRTALQKGIAVYSAHTNLDAVQGGVSWRLAGKLQLSGIRVLSPLSHRVMKLVTFVPTDHSTAVRDAVFSAGAGVIGKYDNCSFSLEGKGSFRAGEGSNPFRGETGSVHSEDEVRFETIFYSHLKDKVLRALMDSHPYEEVAYDLYLLENENIDAGLGCVGNLSQELEENKFLGFVAETLEAQGLRYSELTGRKIKKVALCGGSGAFLLKEAISSGADAFITADIKYHTFQEAAGRILLVDAGHYESEKFSAEILYDLIIKKFPTFALRFSEINTNPINYL